MKRKPLVRHYQEGWPTVSGYPDDTVYSDYLYVLGKLPPHYPMPAIPLQVKYDYVGCVNIDDVTDKDDPVIVYMYDSWTKTNV